MIAASNVPAYARVWKPNDCLTKPELNAAAPPHRLISRSPAPCTSTRLTAGTDSVSSVLPATRPKLQPTPNSSNPMKTSTGE